MADAQARAAPAPERRRSSRATVQPSSYKEKSFVNSSMPRAIYRRSLLPKRKRSRWPQKQSRGGKGGRAKDPIIIEDDAESSAGPPSPNASVSTRAYAFDDD